MYQSSYGRNNEDLDLRRHQLEIRKHEFNKYIETSRFVLAIFKVAIHTIGGLLIIAFAIYYVFLIQAPQLVTSDAEYIRLS